MAVLNMAWELYIRRPDTIGSIDDVELPLGTMQNLREALHKYFPEIHWDSPGSAECSNTLGYIGFSYCGEPVDLIHVRIIDPLDDLLPLTLVAMVNENGWLVVDCGSGEPLESQYPGSASIVEGIQLHAMERMTRPVTSRKPAKRKLPRILTRECLSDKKFARDCLSMSVLANDETTDEVFFKIKPTLFPNDDAPRTRWHPSSGNEEIQLPDGRRLGVLRFVSNQLEHGLSLMDAFYQQTSRITATLTDDFVVLSDGSRFRTAECVFVTRVLGRAPRGS